MKREERIKQIVVSAIVFCVGGLIACDKEELPPVNIQIDLSKPEYAVLNKVGISKRVNGVLIVQYKKNDYRAMLSACTYEGTAVKYDSAKTKFVCPNHGDEFDKDGRVTKGPATIDLHRYNAKMDTTTVLKKRMLIISSL